MASIFTKIIQREIPAHIIAEEEHYIAFLDAMPLVEGHCLVVPKNETDLIFDLESDDYNNLWSFAQHVAKKMKKAFPNKRIAVAVVGLEVPHAHIHLVPISKVEDLNFKNVRLKFSDEEYQETLQKIIKS